MALALVGSTPEGKQDGSLGCYKPTEESYDGKPVYVMTGDEDRKLYHAQGAWWVNDIVGELLGFCKSGEDAASPELVEAGKWEAVNDGKFVPAPELRCVPAEVHEEAMKAKLADANAALRVHLVGTTPSQLESLGCYERSDGALHNDRHVYTLKGDEERMLYYAGKQRKTVD